MKKIYFILVLGLIVSACQPINPEKQQQDFICRSMIQGYLKIQPHSKYKLWSIDMQRPQQIRYTYHAVSENGMMIGTLKNQTLDFECLQNQTTFRLRLKSQQPLMEFQLPEQNL